MITTAIAAGLRRLAVDGGDGDGEILQALIHDLSVAVPSLAGLHLLLSSVDEPVSLRWWREGVPLRDVATSLHLPAAPLLSGSSPRAAAAVARPVVGGITWWATAPGSFVDLAADLAYALDLPLDAISLDRHLDDLTLEQGVFGLEEAALVNRAIGALIADGHPPDEARSVLARAAAEAGTPIHRYAADLLSGPHHPTPDP